MWGPGGKREGRGRRNTRTFENRERIDLSKHEKVDVHISVYQSVQSKYHSLLEDSFTSLKILPIRKHMAWDRSSDRKIVKNQKHLKTLLMEPEDILLGKHDNRTKSPSAHDGGVLTTLPGVSTLSWSWSREAGVSREVEHRCRTGTTSQDTSARGTFTHPLHTWVWFPSLMWGWRGHLHHGWVCVWKNKVTHGWPAFTI